MRRKIFNWFKKTTRLPEGCMLRWYHHILHWVLFPLDSIYWTIASHTYVRYDPLSDIVHIGEHKYSMVLLDGRYLRPGDKIEILKSEHGVIEMRRL